jgi:Family of unknown function (DUF6225)
VNSDEELFDHQVTPWTVGQLRAALEGLPSDMPVRVIPADEPGSDLAGGDQVVISAAPWADVDVGPTGSAGHICIPGATAEDVRRKLASGEPRPDHFEISCEFPSGQYYRRTR